MKGTELCLFFLGLVVLCYCSSHSEAPGTSRKPIADITDIYAFRSYETGREDFVTLIMNVQGLQQPFAGPNYYSLSEENFYEINIDNNGDAVEDITFQLYYGNALGGEVAEVAYDLCSDNTNDCITSGNDKKRDFGSPPLIALKHQGLTLSIDGKDIPIALKVLTVTTPTDQSGLNWFEWYYLNYITGGRDSGNVNSIVNANGGSNQFFIPFDFAGENSFPNYNAYANEFIYDIVIPECPTNGRIFVGQRAESFVINIGPIFDLVNFIPIPGFPGAIQESTSNNQLYNQNIDAIILEVPISCVQSTTTDVIGVWGTVRELHHSGTEHVPGKQVSRLGNPLVNELLIGIVDKFRFNQIQPVEDLAYSLDVYINYPTFPEILNIIFLDAVNTVLNTNLPTLAPTNFPRDDLYAIFMTGLAGINQPPNVVDAEMMRLNLTIEPVAAANQLRYAVLAGDAAGYPNGRRPGDDIIDITLQAAMGVLCTINLYCQPADANVGNVAFTDGAPVYATDFLDSFPYFNVPHTASFSSAYYGTGQ